MKQSQVSYPLNGDKQSSQIGIFPKSGGIILGRTTNQIDVLLPEYFKYLHVGTGGDLVYLNLANKECCYFALPDGATVLAPGYAVLTSGVIDGETVSTTCQLITWHGGE